FDALMKAIRAEDISLESIPALAHTLSKWPAHIERVVPHSMIFELFYDRAPHPSLQLCNTLKVSGFEIDDDMLVSAFANPYLGRLRTIDLSHNVIGERGRMPSRPVKRWMGWCI
ncbi:MAG: hypothetical protein AAFV53_23785, partial [Myxococcota bacterium]